MNSFRRNTERERKDYLTPPKEVEILVVTYVRKEIQIYISLYMYFLIFIGLLVSEFFPGKNWERIRRSSSFRPERIRFWKQFRERNPGTA